MAGRKVNSAYMLLGQIFGKAGLFLSLMVYSRILNDGPFGELLLAISIGLITIFLSDMGVTMLITRRIASGSSVNSTLSSAIILRIGLSILSVSAVMLAGWAGGYSLDQLLLILIVSAGFILDGFCETSYAVFRAREVMINEGAARVLHGSLGILLALFAWYTGRGVYFAGASYVMRQVPALIFVYGALHRMGFRFDRSSGVLKTAVPLLKASVPLGIAGILMAAGLRLDSVFVKAQMGDAAVAAYQQGIKILESMILIVTPTLLPGSLFPALCDATRSGWGKARERIAWMTELFTVIAGVLILSLWAGGLQILEIVWGSEYLRGVQPETVLLTFRIILVTLPAAYYFHLYMSVIIAEERQKMALPYIGLSLAVQIALLFLLVPGLGITGAAIAFFSLFSLVAVLFSWRLRKIHGSTGFVRGVRRPFAAFVSSFALVLLHPFAPVTDAVLSVALFFALWYVMGGKRIIPDFHRASSPGN